MSNTTTATAANVWTFAPDAVTVNGRTFPASYSLARSGDVYVFATVKAAADAADVPVRLHISATMPMHADAVAAAEAARKASKPAPVQEQPAHVQEQPAPVQEQPAPVQEQPAPVQDKPAPVQEQPAPVQEQPAPVQEQPAPAKKPRRSTAKKASKPAPVEQPAPVQEQPAPVQEQPAPVQDKPDPVQEQPAPVAGKAWIGTTIQGKGWSIAFDADAGRTRVQVEGTPTDAQRSAIEQAGFYWSSQLKSWNKKLTCKAYRAAQALATTLNALA